jgi:hypothetical protein
VRDPTKITIRNGEIEGERHRRWSGRERGRQRDTEE